MVLIKYTNAKRIPSKEFPDEWVDQLPSYPTVQLGRTSTDVANQERTLKL